MCISHELFRFLLDWLQNVWAKIKLFLTWFFQEFLKQPQISRMITEKNLKSHTKHIVIVWKSRWKKLSDIKSEIHWFGSMVEQRAMSSSEFSKTWFTALDSVQLNYEIRTRQKESHVYSRTYLGLLIRSCCRKFYNKTRKQNRNEPSLSSQT